MSILFPKVNKPRQWDYRPIYYDAEKEKRAERRRTLHKGAFREAHEKNMHNQARHKSKLVFWIVLLAMLLFAFYFLL